MHLESCKATRLPSGTPALGLAVRIPDIKALHALRDRVLDGRLQRDVNRKLDWAGLTFQVENSRGVSKKLAWAERAHTFQVDNTRFFELYEDSLLGLSKLTEHQEDRLKQMNGMRKIHLFAPAGTGKTFLAIHHLFELLRIKPSASVLYVAPSEALGLHFLQWLVARLAPKATDSVAEVHQVFSRLTFLHAPYTHFVRPDLDGACIFRKPVEAFQPFDQAIFDESHKIFPEDAHLTPAMKCGLAAGHILLMSDPSQSSAVSQSYPEMGQVVELKEVVRSTQRLVAGAGAFRLNVSGEAPVTCLGTEGPPLKTYLFDCKEPKKKLDEYAAHVITALWYVAQMFPGISFHRRIALLVPDSGFCGSLKPILQKWLKEQLPHRDLSLVCFREALSCLPGRLLGTTQSNEKELIILDSVDNADGLEQLVVICVGLDAPIDRAKGDLQTRARLYRGITRAQLLAVVVNESVPGGWLQFLGAVQFMDSKLQEEELTASAKSATKIQEEALRHVGALQSHTGCTKPQRSNTSDSGLPRPTENETRKLVSLKESSVWDTRSNKIARPTSLLFDPMEDRLASRKPKQPHAQSLMPRAAGFPQTCWIECARVWVIYVVSK